MTPHYEAPGLTLHLGDCVEVMAAMPAESVDAIVCDPPYDLTTGKRGGTGAASIDLTTPYGRARIGVGNGGGGFMGKAWDATGVAFDPATWRLALRVLKPGGHLLAFGGTRTFHRLTCAIEDAGFEIRDCLSWLYGSGFPKSLDVSKAIDRAAGAEREVVGDHPWAHVRAGGKPNDTDKYGDGTTRGPLTITAPATPEAARWQGWGTALKPAWEPVVVARKPLRGTVAANVLAHGTGALNVDGCRVGTDEALGRTNHVTSRFIDSANGSREAHARTVTVDNSGGLGRWPANVVMDEAAAARLDAEVGERPSGGHPPRRGPDGDRNAFGAFAGQDDLTARGHEVGGVSRFFYTAKASTAERDGATHPTVKPIALMRWLVRLVTPPGGVVLDPFSGSGTTLIAAREEGFRAVGIEREEEYAAMIVERWNRRYAPAEAEWADARSKDDDQLSLLGGTAA